MSEIPINKLLDNTFPKSNKDDWRKVASGELNGNEPFKQLAWNIGDSLTFSPYYDKQDLQHFSLHGKFIQRGKKDSFLGNRAWYNQPMVTVNNDADANKSALEHLRNGADGVLFQLSSTEADLGKLLNEIEPEYCALSFNGVNARFVEMFYEYIRRNKITTEKLTGSFFWDKLPEDRVIPSLPSQGIKSLGLNISHDEPLNEITTALFEGAKALSAANDEKQLAALAQNISFSLQAHNDFLTQIAKLKTLRLLWFQVVQAYGVKSYHPQDLHIHVACAPWINEKFQPHGNMLHATTSAMSSVIGGADAIAVLPEEETNTTMNRIARNVSNILREESHFDKVSDPLAGSYVVEAMVDQMAQKAWSMFQKKHYANVEA